MYIDYATGAITTDGPFMVRMVDVVSSRDGFVASCRLPTDLQAQEPETTDIVLRDIDGDGDGDLVVASEEWTGQRATTSARYPPDRPDRTHQGGDRRGRGLRCQRR